MFSDPLSVTYDGSSISLPRTAANGERTVYTSANKEFQISIWSNSNKKAVNGVKMAEVEFSRLLPDPTPSNSFDSYREIRNGFTVRFLYDITRTELGDLDLLREALLDWLTPTFQSRLLAGEK